MRKTESKLLLLQLPPIPDEEGIAELDIADLLVDGWYVHQLSITASHALICLQRTMSIKSVTNPNPFLEGEIYEEE